MSHRNPQRPRGASSFWPYDAKTFPGRVHTEGDWKMGMSAGGSMVIWPAQQPFPAALGLLEAFRGTLEQLERFHTVFCMRGYESDDLHKYQDGLVWLFNWISGTPVQIDIAGQVAKKLFDGDYDGAWAVGRSFEEWLQRAEAADRRYGGISEVTQDTAARE